MRREEKIAQYPQMAELTNLKNPREISKNHLNEIFLSHEDKFEKEYKLKLFELGKNELTREA